MPLRLLFCLFALTATPAIAQPDAVTSTPESITEGFNESFNALDFDRTAGLMHPRALQEIKDLLVEMAALDSTTAFLFTGGNSAPSSMSPADAFAAFMTATVGMQRGVREALSATVVTPLGHVVEADTLAHVVTRTRVSMMNVEITKMGVVTVQQHDGEWKALLSGDLSNVIQALRAQAAARSTDAARVE